MRGRRSRVDAELDDGRVAGIVLSSAVWFRCSRFAAGSEPARSRFPACGPRRCQIFDGRFRGRSKNVPPATAAGLTTPRSVRVRRPSIDRFPSHCRPMFARQSSTQRFVGCDHRAGCRPALPSSARSRVDFPVVAVSARQTRWSPETSGVVSPNSLSVTWVTTRPTWASVEGNMNEQRRHEHGGPNAQSSCHRLSISCGGGADW